GEAAVAAAALPRERLPATRAAGWRSEETEDDPARLQAADVGVVDPIDGPRAYLAGLPDWTISAALVRAARPVVAALYAPVTDEMFLATAGGGATRNGAPIAASVGAALAGAEFSGAKRRMESLAAVAPGTQEMAAGQSRCASPASRPGRSTEPSPLRTAMTGTLRRPIFWCTKPAGRSPL